MSRVLLATLVFASLAVVGLGVWFLGSSSITPPAALAPPAPASASEGDAGGSSPQPSEPRELTLVAAPSPPQPGSQGERLALGEAAPDGPPMELLAVAYDTREVLPETVFHWAAVSDAKVFFEGDVEADSVDVEALLGRIGRKVVADEVGIAEVIWPGETLAVSARNGSDFTVQLVRDYDPGPIEIELFPDLSLAIQTLARGGEPLSGVPVGLFRMRGDGKGERALWTSVTEGEQAIAEMRHAYFRLHNEFERFDLYAALDTLTAENPTAPLDASAWPDGPLELILPATGSVAVDVTDEGGNVPPGTVKVDVQLTDEQGREIRLPDGGKDRRLRIETETGSAHFGHVGIGLNLRVRARSIWSSAGEVEVPGPVEAGEIVTVAVQLGEFHPGVTVRLLDPGGQPLPSRSIEVRLIRITSSYAAKSWREETDEEGRLTLPVGVGLGKQRSLRLTLLGESDEALLRGELDLTRELPEGLSDLGDVELQPLPSVVEGVVLNGEGLPVSEARLRVRSHSDGNWRSVPGLEALSDAYGKFEIRGDAPAGTLRLHASKGSYTPAEPIEFVAGARSVEVVLDQAGGLAGSLVLHESVPFRDVIIDAATLEDGDRWVVRKATRLMRSGTFQINELAAGAYAVRVRRAGDPVPLWEAFGVTVYGGEVSHDPRLQGIDLRHALFSIRVEVLNHRHEPLEQGRVRVYSESSEARSSAVAYAIRDGEAQIVSRDRYHDLEISSEGFVTAHLRGVDSDQRVVLQPAIRVRLQLPGDVRLPKPPLFLRAMLVPDVTGTGRRSKKLERQTVSVFRDGLRVSRQHPFYLGGEPVFDDERIVELVVREPGRQILDFAIVRRVSQGRYRSVRSVGPPKNRRLVTVTPTDGGRVYRAQPEPNQYKKLLKKLR